MGVSLGSRKANIDFTGEVNFDHFKVVRLIGRGAFGKVCLVKKIDTKKKYAMKYVNKAGCLETRSSKNTLCEQKILASLDGQCPFIVNLWFSFQDIEDLFFVVDYMAGGDLRYHLHNGSFGVDRTRFYVAEIALALDYLHRNNIIHRDIKPDNLLLDAEGHVHLTDFNAAHMDDPDKKKPCSVVGTWSYMAPEVLLAAKEGRYTKAVDWWSLGITMYECLALKVPFKISLKMSRSTIADYFEKATIAFPSDLSVECIEVIKALLRVSILERVQTIDALKGLDFFRSINFEHLWNCKVEPPFVPPANNINCDPVHELEEMMLESQPLHKKRKRSQKRASRQGKEPQPQDTDLVTLEKEFFVFDRLRGGIIIKEEGSESSSVNAD